jgi:hypothetical protein
VSFSLPRFISDTLDILTISAFLVGSGTYDCLDDDVEGSSLSVSISNFEDGDLLFEAPTDAREGSFALSDLPEASKYSLCFENHLDKDDDDNVFDVGFSIRVNGPSRSLPEDEIGPDAERALKLAEKATAIHQDWNAMMDHLMFVRNREAVHISMSESILSRLARWTYIEAFLVVGMATGQVLYWKKFFETRRYL